MITTNVIAYLHTTLAYQSAVLHLMVGQANFDAQQLHLSEPLPMVAPASTNDWMVAMPPYGVTGRFSTPNYIYQFQAGKLVSILKRPQRRGAAANPAETQPSLIDTNGAYQIATQGLTGIGVDVPALERKYPHTILQSGSRSSSGRVRNAATNSTTSRPTLFRVTWGGASARPGAPNESSAQVIMEILGSTKQCAGLRVLNPEVLKGPPLQVTNAATLLGAPPSPQHFVAEFLGGNAAYNCIAQPDKVTAWLISPQTDEPDSKTNRTPAMSVNALAANQLSKTLTDFNSFSWLEENNCTPDYGVGLRFTKGAETVEFHLCFECDALQVTHNGQSAEKDCPAARAALVQAIQAVFPTDAVIKNLRLSNQPK
jgi:hypothetical protein